MASAPGKQYKGKLAPPPPPAEPGPITLAQPGGGPMDVSMAAQTPLPTFQAPTPGTVNPGTFGTPAPTSTPFGDFTAPDPAQVANDPYYQFRLEQGRKNRERSAAARGTLLTGGTLKSLEDFASGLASEEGGKMFDRALAGYNTNRATNAQNFGQNMDTFQGNLGAFNANTGATLGAFNANTNAALGAAGLDLEGKLGLYDREAAANEGAGQAQAESDYARSVAATKAMNDANLLQLQQVQPRKTAIGRPFFKR